MAIREEYPSARRCAKIVAGAASNRGDRHLDADICAGQRPRAVSVYWLAESITDVRTAAESDAVNALPTTFAPGRPDSLKTLSFSL